MNCSGACCCSVCEEELKKEVSQPPDSLGALAVAGTLSPLEAFAN